MEWVGISGSRGSCRPRDPNTALTLKEDSIPTEPPGTTDNISNVDIVSHPLLWEGLPTVLGVALSPCLPLQCTYSVPF